MTGGASEGPETAARYLFPPLDRRGVLLGLRPLPLGTLVAGVVMAFGAVHSLPGPFGVGLAAGILALAVVGAFWPVGGQPSVQWLPTLTRWLLRRGRTPILDDEATSGWRAGVATGSSDRPLPPAPGSGRGPLRSGRRPSATAPLGIRLGRCPSLPGEGELGVVEDLVARSWAAVLPVQGPALTLLGPEDQARRLAAWGTVLATVARDRTAIRRIQWVDQCLPADPDVLRVAAAGASGPMRAAASYRRLVDVESSGVTERRTYLVVAVHGRRSIAPRSLASGPLGELLRREIRLLRAQLRAADIDADEALAPGALAAVLRASTDPTRPLAAHGRPVGCGAAAWPAAVEDRWASVRVDGCWHCTYWVAEWPRLAVGPDVLGPLLLAATTRTIAVTMAPVPADRAVRQVQSARTAALADDALRSRAGFIATAQREREVEGVRRREAELADGHSEYRYSAYVTVSARTPEDLEAAAAEMEQTARQCHLVLRRQYGRQAEARAWTLPIGRGLS